VVSTPGCNCAAPAPRPRGQFDGVSVMRTGRRARGIQCGG
jgi:hypothetical protein